MKNLMKLQTLLIVLMVSSAMIFGSCKKDSTPPGDKTTLTAALAAADVKANTATTAMYPQAAIDAYKASIATIKTASASTSLTQAEVDAQITALNTATATFTTTATASYATLSALITASETMANAATTADYPQAAITTFKATIATTKTAAATLLTEVQTTNLTTNLTEAKKTFQTQIYGYIDETATLNAGWHFDEGTGTTATAFSTVKHVATFKAGNAVIMTTDAKSPTWVAGVKGGSAVYLTGGAHLEVPYTNAFLPTSLTISVWVKPDELYENNYIVSQNFWQGYKLQTQGGGKPFFTFNTTKATSSIIDADNELDNSIKASQWNHIVVSVNSSTKELKMYVNGTLTKTWTEATKGIAPLIQTLTAPGPQPFIIGCCATDDELANDVGVGWMGWTTKANFGYFKGVVDELKIYNVALADGQVAKLYNDEKP